MPKHRYTRIPIDEIKDSPSGIVQCIKNHWWCVTEQNEVLLFKGSTPQCNSNKAIVDRLMPAGCHAEFLPTAFVKVNISDYIY